MAKKIMILGASILQLPSIVKAKEMGLKVVVLDFNPNAIGFKEEGIVKEVVSTIDIPAVVECAEKHKVDGVMTLASDMPMRAVAAVCKELKLPGIDDATALRATNKAEMRKALFEHGVPVPKFFKVSNRKEYENAVKEFKQSFIVKPADNSGSRGIFKISDLQDQKTIYEAYDYSRASSRNGDVVVEEYMNGPEVSVETLTIDGVCHVIQITDKLTTGAPHFVEMGHTQPTNHPIDIANRIKEVAIAANKAIGIKNGPSHTEIIVTDEGPKIVELGARLGGDCITTHLVPLSTGVNMVECCIKIALGEKPDITPKFQKASAIRYLHQHEGKIKKISGVDAASKVKGIQQISIIHGENEEIGEITDSASRMGFVIAQCDTREEAIKACDQALNLIKVEMK